MRRCLLALALVLLGSSALRAQDLAPVAPVSSTTYPLTLLNGAPYVELSVGGARGLFLFDTGANGSAVDRAWLEQEGVSWKPAGMVGVLGTTGGMQVQRGSFPRLDLGNAFYERPTFNLQDFSKFLHPDAGPQVGLLGTDFINDYRATIDYRSRQLRLELKQEREPLDPQAWQPLALTYVERIPTAVVRLAGLDFTCRLDSGASYTNQEPLLDVNQATVQALRAAGVALEERGALFVVGASGPETLTLLGGAHEPLALEVGPRRLDDVTLVVHSSGTLAVSSPVTLASASVLARLETLVVDPFDHLLWLPRPQVAEPPAPPGPVELVPGQD